MPKNEEYETEHMETGACSHTAASINLVQFLSCGELAVLQRRTDSANIFPNIHHATDSPDRKISNAMHCCTWTMNIYKFAKQI